MSNHLIIEEDNKYADIEAIPNAEKGINNGGGLGGTGITQQRWIERFINS